MIERGGILTLDSGDDYYKIFIRKGMKAARDLIFNSKEKK